MMRHGNILTGALDTAQQCPVIPKTTFLHHRPPCFVVIVRFPPLAKGGLVGISFKRRGKC